MNKRWFLLAVLALSSVTLVAMWSSMTMEKSDQDQSVSQQPESITNAPPLSITWDLGSAQRYQVTSDSSMNMQATGKGASTIRVNLKAALDTLILETSADNILVGMQLSSVVLKINDTSDSDTNNALSSPFRVKFTKNGMPITFEFPTTVNNDHRTILENLIRTFQLSLENNNNWTTTESNGSGNYEAFYKQTGANTVEKSKRNFSASSTGMIHWTDFRSTENIKIETGHNWLTSMDVNETMRSEGQGGPAMTVKNHATLNLQPEVKLTLNSDLWQFETASASIDSPASLKRAVPDITIQEARAQILSTVPELDASKQGRLALIHKLRDLLLVDEALPAVILEILQTEQLEDRTRADLYLVLEQAGTESAQSALAEVISDNRWSLKDGMRAIVAMGGIKQPTVESISTLWSRAQYNNDNERQRMTSSATFALGSIGNTLHKADSPEYSSLRSELLSNAMSGADVTQRSNFITALGNTDDPTLANEVVVLLNDSEPAIRRAAALSLSTLGTEQVADSLVSHYTEEENTYVRGAIAESLQSWEQPTSTAMAMFRKTVQSEPDESTRYNIAILLAGNLEKFPENETVLRELMRKEPSKRIRQKVAQALSTQKTKP